MHVRPVVFALTLALAAVPSAAARAGDDVAPPAPAAPPAAGEPAAPAPAAEEALEWVGDFDKAVTLAKAQQKDLLVDFTGSDWCPWCIKLHEEVFVRDAFRPVAKDYVLVSLDFPRDPRRVAKVPNPQRNEEVRAKYDVQGFPTVLLMTPEGDVFGGAQYEEGGAEKYVAMLGKLRATGRPGLIEALAIAKAFEGAEGDARAAAAEQAVAKLETAERGRAWAARLFPAVRAAGASDPDNAKGLRLRSVNALLRSGVNDPALVADARKLDPKNAKGVLEEAALVQLAHVEDDDGCRAFCASVSQILDGGAWKDIDNGRLLLGTAAYWSKGGLKDDAGARRFALKLKEIAKPEDEHVRQLLESILGDGGKAEKAPEKAEKPGEEDGDGEDEGDEPEEIPGAPR